MMNNTGRKVFESQASLICCLHNETSVLDKHGNELEENLTDKKNREKLQTSMKQNNDVFPTIRIYRNCRWKIHKSS